MPEFPGTLKPPRLDAAPSTPVKGQLYYDNATNTLRWWDGSQWVSAAGGVGGADLIYNGEYPAGGPTYTDGDIVIANGVPYLCVRPTSSPPTPWGVSGAGLTGPPGPQGNAGTPGEQWFTGSGAPSGATGIVGDWYLDSATGDYYEKTGASTWTLRGNLKGPQGNTGNTGVQGPAGPTYELSAVGPADAAIANTETVVVAEPFAANVLTAGMTFMFKAYATRVGTQNASEIVRIRVGPTTLTGQIAATITPPTSNVAVPIEIEGLVTIRSAGAGGTALGSLKVVTHLAAVTITAAISPSTATVPVDTTVAQRIELTLISGNASNTYTFRNAVFWRVA